MVIKQCEVNMEAQNNKCALFLKGDNSCLSKSVLPQKGTTANCHNIKKAH